MAPEEELKKRIGRKLTKKKKEGHQVTMEIPERFKDGEDADEDITAPSGGNAMMNQSIFGMIAAAGSQVDFNARFDGQSSDDEDDSEASNDESADPRAQDIRSATPTAAKPEKHRRKISESRALRSLVQLGKKSRSKSARVASGSPAPGLSDAHSEAGGLTRTPSRPAPIMSQMLEAKAELSLRSSFDASRKSSDLAEIMESDTGTSILAKRLMEIFEFEVPEEVIEEYPCWLLKSVLLQGYMYITTKHICFFAYLPKKENAVAKSGYLSKRGLKNPKYNRYWFRLQGDVLSYYTNPSDLYFPSGNIDLRYGISASVSMKEKANHGMYFDVVTNQRKYHFKADSAPSAKEWVKALQKIIFRSHNDGDSVKISLPIENVIDIEDSHVVEFAETCKIRVIDNDETFAIDEYFFSFFSFGREALNVLRILVEDTAAHQIPEDLLIQQPGQSRPDSPKGSMSKRHSMHLTRDQKPVVPPIRTSTPVLQEHVKATLSPLATGTSPRASGEYSRGSFDGYRRSIDMNKFSRRSVDMSKSNMDGAVPVGRDGARSMSRSRAPEKQTSELQDSSDSFVHSIEEPESSAAVPSMSEETQGSASQILRGSEVFFSPTIQRAASPGRLQEQGRTRGTQVLSQSPTRMDLHHPKPRHSMTTGSMDAPMDHPLESAMTGPSLQNLVKAGSYPLQRAAGFAGYLNRHSKRMGSLLATESMGYVEKVSGMWKGGKVHYAEANMGPDDDLVDEPDEKYGGTKDRFRDHFALPPTEKLQATYFAYLHRVLPLYGKIYISDRSFCFRSLLPGTRTKVILPLKDIENVDKEKGFRFGYSGLVIVIRGHEEIFFEFGQPDARDDCAVTLLQNLETMRFLKESGLLSLEEKESAENAVAEHKALQEARQDGHVDHELKLPKSTETALTTQNASPIVFDDPRASILNFKPSESLRITCLTIGSRGDVQPYIALCKGFIKEGHKPRIATHIEFKDWVESHGIEFAVVDGDPAELMRICVDNGMFTYSFLKEASTTFRGWIDDLLTSSWKACQDTDLLIESPSAMGGIHIAEALEIPYFRAFTMPWTRTRAYPHAFVIPEHKLGGAYNYITYVMFDNVFWKAIAGQINRWRKNELGLRRTNLEKLQPNKVPFLYNFSPSVVPPPLDYSDWIRVTGYWFLDEGTVFDPPKRLTDFIKKARDDKKKIVYIGFGSIVVADSAALTKIIVDSVLKADVRCILSKGWSDRLDKTHAVPQVLPDDVLEIKSAPHDWLFKQVDAAAHHGGAGTTGASLRAGLPTIIKPFFGDQFFSGSRVEDLGVGIYLRKMNVSVFSRALWEAVHSERMIVKARVLGELIRKEDGVDTAIQSIYRDLDYAKSLIKHKDGKVDDVNEDSEESWTFIGDDNDPELVRRIHDWEAMSQSGMAAERNKSITSHKMASGSRILGKEHGVVVEKVGR